MKLARAASISSILLEEGLGFLTGKGGDDTERPPEAETAARLRRTLERLGPTFVKFGQMLATRVDLFGPAVTDELSKLHAAVEPYPTTEARRILEEELGRPVEEVFVELPDEPVAAASIAQVYRAVLRTGETVAIKIQRPGIDETLQADLDTLLVLSGFIDRLVPPYRAAMVDRVAREYALRARSELDFRAEAHAVERFTGIFETFDGFRAPALVPALCTRRVLVMEWVEGTKLADVSGPDELRALGFDPDAFGRNLLRLQIVMAYEHGFMHGDTHPGNLLLEPDGTVVLIDYGLHAEVPLRLRERMMEMVFAQVSGEVDAAVESFVRVFPAGSGRDVGAYKKELEGVLAVDVSAGIAQERVTDHLVRGMRVGAKYDVQAQSEMFMVIRNLTIVEGLVIRYAPDVEANAVVRDTMADILRRRLFGPRMQEELQQLIPQLALTLSQRPRLAKRLMKLERSFNESVSLGEFLRNEGVIQPVVRAPHPAWFVVVGLLGVVVGLLVGRL